MSGFIVVLGCPLPNLPIPGPSPLELEGTSPFEGEGESGASVLLIQMTLRSLAGLAPLR